MLDEQILDVEDIQGHILVGFGVGHQRLIGIKFRPQAIGEARRALLPWVDRVTRTSVSQQVRAVRAAAKAKGLARPDSGILYVAMSLSVDGLTALGAPSMPSDPFFRDGAARSARGLKDDVDASDGTPIGWKFGATPETTPDVLIVLGADTEDRLSTEAAALISDLGDSVDIVCREEGSRLDKDTEHFGFVDGISQPGVRGLIGVDQPLTRRSFPESDPRSTLYSRPGQPLVWPGQFLFGYHTQRADDHAPGPPSEADNAFLRNGSLLVYRRLRQDVGAFREGMRVLVQKFAAKGVVIDEDKAAAWSVGRWPDGTPVSLSPDGPNAKISESSVLRNGFLFDAAIGPASLVEESGPISFPGAADDKLGSNCPFFAHIRKVNPRDHVVDQGSSGITLRSQMLRRGIPYGPRWPGKEDGEDRGLQFLTYQTSIENQFNRLMTLWVNNGQAPPPGEGVDPLIGNPGSIGRPLIRRTSINTSARVILPGRWVTATGAGYFFAPGISALRRLVGGLVA